MKQYKTVEDYISSNTKWEKELTFLRKLLNKTELKETIKWGLPVYTINGKNVAGLGAFKSFVGIWFFQGALLNDPKKLLVNAQEGKTQAMRQLRFDSYEKMNKEMIMAYIQEAIKNQKEGKIVPIRKSKPLIIPDELQTVFKKEAQIKENFNGLNLTRQREFVDYISEAKKEETRNNRIKKIIPMIKRGMGLNDKYRG